MATGNVLVAGNVVYGNKSSGSFPAIYAAGVGVEVARNVVYDNWNGISASGTGPVRENRVYGNLANGISTEGNVPVLSNIVYNNGSIGITAGSSLAEVSHNVIYLNTLIGLKISSGSPDVVNNTIYQQYIETGDPCGDLFSNPVRQASAAHRSDAVLIEGNAHDVELRNIFFGLRAIWRAALFPRTGLRYRRVICSPYDRRPLEGLVGLLSEYNLFYVPVEAYVGSWLGATQTTLQQWQTVSSRDTNSLSNNPLFVASMPRHVFGYVSGVSNGSDDDFHLQSPFGSLHGAALAPSLSVATALPVFPVGMLVNDAVASPAIDRGADTDSFASEPAPNGGAIDIGAFGIPSRRRAAWRSCY